MNKKLMGLILLLALPLTAMAVADTDGYHHDSSKRVEHMTKELGLSAEQKTQVTAIFEAQQEKFKALHAEMDTSLKAVLTPEQYTKFEAAREKRKEAHKERMNHKK